MSRSVHPYHQAPSRCSLLHYAIQIDCRKTTGSQSGNGWTLRDIDSDEYRSAITSVAPKRFRDMQRYLRCQYHHRIEPLEFLKHLEILTKDFFGSEGWGFESLRARHLTQRRNGLSSTRLLHACEPAFASSKATSGDGTSMIQKPL